MANATVKPAHMLANAARPYVAAAILSADTIANNYISVLENVHSKRFSVSSQERQSSG